MAPSSPAQAVRTVIVTTLGSWRQEWDELVEQAPVPSPFLSSWWLAGVAQGNEHFVLFVEGDSLIGGLALDRRELAGVARYRFWGSGKLCPDHLDALAARGRQDAVGSAIRAWFERPGSRVLDLSGLVEESLLAGVFDAAVITTIDIAPWDELPADAAVYLAARSANFRRTVRKARRRMTEGGATCRRITGEQARLALDDFAVLLAQRRDRGALLREMPRLRRALVAGLDTDAVQVNVMESANTIQAMAISFRIGGALRAYQNVRWLGADVRDAGTVLLVDIAERACAEGYRELDLLRGPEEYKFRLVDRQRRLQRIQIAHGAAGHAALAALLGWERIRPRLGRIRGWLQDHRGVGGVDLRRRRTAV